MAPTQQALYADIDLDLSWSERDLPERERTKHVHRLHPYLGKFIPQLVEILLGRYFAPRQHVLDPFAGSGTTLVQALESGLDATGADIAAFNVLLMQVKTRPYNLFTLEHELRDVCARIEAYDGTAARNPSRYVRDWYAPVAAAELVHFRSLIPEYEHADVLRIVLARAARSARRTTHFDLDFPREPQLGPYWCHKHKRECRPVERAEHFLRRYALDTLARVKAFAQVRARGREATVHHADARELAWGGPFDGIVTSPPYPGLIDYHEQHRYAYELLGLDDRRSAELGRAERGSSRAALAEYVDGIVAALANARVSLRPGAPVVIVVNDRRDLYPEILERAGLTLEERYRRHVNRRTGRRAGEFYEDVLVARAGSRSRLA
ncbi:MAG: site-specific DNA-methyltransferase, partial [Actinomycetota bacterium]|nr:site-specific DNA-methyltransferase [Actinomycetota bacterium]